MSREHTNRWIRIVTNMYCGAYFPADEYGVSYPCPNRACWEEVRVQADVDAAIPARLRCTNDLPKDAVKELP